MSKYTISPAAIIETFGTDDAAGYLADWLGLLLDGGPAPDATLDYTWACGVERRDWSAHVLAWRVSEGHALVCLSSYEAGRNGWSLLDLSTDDLDTLLRDYAEESGDGPSGCGEVVTGDLYYHEAMADCITPE